MQAQLVFAFPFDVSAIDAIHAVANHFAVGVSIAGAPANVPAHIKQAVERIGADDPSNGAETSAAVAFGGLVNGGNAQAAPQAAQFSAVAATSTTVHAASPGTLATTPLASSAPALPNANAGVAPVASAATANPASNAVEFDSTGLPWDARIHSGNKTKTPKGEWRAMKGCNKSIIKTIELELRAKYPNVSTGASAAVSAASATNAAPTVTADPIAANVHAHAEALRVAGPQLLDDATCVNLRNGIQYQLSPEQGEWYAVYRAKYQAAYAEFMAGNVVSAPPVAPASPQTTGNEVAAQPAAPVTPVASQTAAVGTVAPASNAPLDAAGLPHDTRIHIGAALKDSAGVWIQRHDVPGETKLLVMAELRAKLGNGAEQVASTPADPASTPVAPTPPAVPVISAADAGTDFAKMMQWIVANQIAGRIAATAGPEAAKTLGFIGGDGNGQLALMTQQAAYWPHVVMLLQGQGAI